MVQGFVKHNKSSGAQSKNKNAKIAKSEAKKAKFAKKGNVTQLPKTAFRDIALEDKALSKAIDKSNEQKMAAKVVQDGGKLKTTDLLQRGKELNRENRRAQVKKKLTRVEEKLKSIRETAEKQGKI
jgi:hypothetical protein